MTAAGFMMVSILIVASLIIAVVMVGLHGAGADHNPDLARVLSETARHLNGEGEPPKGLVAFFDEIPDSADVKTKVAEAKARLRP